jgi:SAM-dependent methyltransferase
MAKHLSCPICSAEEGWPVQYQRNERIDTWRAEIGDCEPYGWLLCPRCTSFFPSHQPDLRVVRRVWESARTEEESGDAAALRKRRDTIGLIGAERSFRFFSPLASGPPGRFLDIGCGFGQTVKKFSDSGWDAEGIDPDPVTEIYHRRLGIRTRIGLLEDLDLGNGYAIIHIAHAIYFVTNPMEFLREVRRQLQPNGLFCIVLADFLVNEDPGLPTYAHTFLPNGASMRYALALAGFETISIRRQYGSIYLAARPSSDTPSPRTYPAIVITLWRTKWLRYQLLGRPHLALRKAAKAVLSRLGLRG